MKSDKIKITVEAYDKELTLIDRDSITIEELMQHFRTVATFLTFVGATVERYLTNEEE